MNDTMLGRLQREHAGRWDTWTVHPLTGSPTWHTRPAGAPSCVHQETTGEHMEAWLAQGTALQDKGVSFEFGRDGWTITATITYTSPATGTPETYGPAPVPQVITDAENQLRKVRTPMTPHPARPDEEQLSAWQASGKRYQAIAAAIAAWAATQEPGTALPADDHFSGDLDFIASPDTYRRARRLLTANGIIKATSTRTYQVP